MAALSCFVGDADPLLVRVPGTALRMFGTLWLLTQGESRKTKRVRLFTEFVSAGSPRTCHFSRDCPFLRLTSGRSPTTLAVTPVGCRAPIAPSDDGGRTVFELLLSARC
jgi:hypothetical protein